MASNLAQAITTSRIRGCAIRVCGQCVIPPRIKVSLIHLTRTSVDGQYMESGIGAKSPIPGFRSFHRLSGIYLRLIDFVKSSAKSSTGSNRSLTR